MNPASGQVIAGARSADGSQLLDARRALLRGENPHTLLSGSNTTIGVVATDATLTKVQARRLAMSAHDGLARAINPVHTMSDGDSLFALGTGQSGKSLGMMTLCTLAAEAAAVATARAILLATAVEVTDQPTLPAAADMAAT